MIPIQPDNSPSHQTRPARVVETYLKPGILNLSALPPLSLYLHFPWCVRKCPYCDFNSHEASGSVPEQAYLDALRADLEQALPLIWGRKIYTIFIGGGTPSLLSAAGLDRLMSDVRSLLPIDGAAEITMEANPGTFEAEKFASYAGSGINRLSIGIQSFNSQHLSALGRIHDGDEARRAIDIAQANFSNINLDLMYALPEQTLAQAREDIATAIGFAPSHLSLYHLTMEPNTVFAKYPPSVPDDDASAAMQDMLAERTASAGYRHYEVSAFAQAGRQARYKQPAAYMQHAAAGNAIAEEAEITRDELGFEFMLNASRLTEGFDVRLFSERTGLGLNGIEQGLNLAERKGLIERDHKRIRPTALGQRFLNDLQQIFLPD